MAKWFGSRAIVQRTGTIAILLGSLMLHSTTPASFSQSATPTPEAVAFLDQGLALRFQGDSAAASLAFAEAIKLSPTYAEAYVAKASLLHKQGFSQLAIEAYDQAIRLNPTLVAAYLGKAQTLARQGKRPEARALLRSTSGAFRARGDYQRAAIIEHLLPE